jgi:hypothetical protein
LNDWLEIGLHPPHEVVLVHLLANDRLVHLAQLVQGEGLGQEAVRVRFGV